MYDIITIGEILVEILTEQVDQVFSKPGVLLGPYPSGAPAIMIDQAARMGAKSAIIARVGPDDFARLNRERLQADGVDVRHIIETPGNSTGVAFVTYFKDGSRQFIFHFSKAACGELSPADVRAEVIEHSKALHIMGCSITGSPTMGEAIMEAVRLASRAGVLVSFDPNIRPELLTGKVMDDYQEILGLCDVLLTGKSELQVLFPDADRAIAALLTQKDRVVVVKDGGRGTSVYARDEAFWVGPYPADEVDPTGAGDCFDGTFLALRVRGATLREAADMANAAGALAVSMRGPMEGNSSRDALDAFRERVTKPEIRDIKHPLY